MGIGYCNRCKRYGGHDTNCPTVVVEPGEQQLRSRIKQLTARVRELTAEVERLSVAHVKACQANADSQAELAASQAYAEQLQVALQTFIDEHEECTDADDWMAMLCSIEAHHVAEEALALPRDTSALDAYVEQKVKEASTQLLEKLEQLTRQRDLAVEALEHIARSLPQIGVERVWMMDHANKVLSTIKESEAK